MSDFRELARDPKHRRRFEKLLRLAVQRGDADQVAERLSWGIDPNCTFAKGRNLLMANVRSSCPSAATVEILLKHGTDANVMDETGLTALDYARRKLARLQVHKRRPPRKSPSLDENNQLQLGEAEQAELDRMRSELGDHGREFLQHYWQARLRAARRVFNDPAQIERIVELLEAAANP
jgi:hypothetical protein